MQSVRSGLGENKTKKEKSISVDELCKGRAQKNKVLISKLREDMRSEELMRLTQEDVRLGRMRPLRGIHEVDLGEITVSPRFCVAQGE